MFGSLSVRPACVPAVHKAAPAVAPSDALDHARDKHVGGTMSRWPVRLGTTIAAAGLVAASGLLAVPGVAGAGHGGDHGTQRDKDIQLPAINDFHGNLEPPAGSSGLVTRLQPDGTTVPQTVGGVAYLSTHL